MQMPFLDFIIATGATPVIPPRANRTEARDYDKHLYRERHWLSVLSTRSNTIAASFLV